MKERQRNRLISPVHLMPGDKLICKVQDRKTRETHEFHEDFDRHLVIDTIVTFDVDTPVLGLVDGIGAIFGTAK